MNGGDRASGGDTRADGGGIRASEGDTRTSGGSTGDTRSRSRRRRVAPVALGLAAAAALLAWAFDRTGRWLVVADELAPADAIFVFNGHFPFRSIEAGRLHREGWADEVWLVRVGRQVEVAEALERLGVELLLPVQEKRMVLEAMGVATSSIRVLEGEVRNTADEIRRVARELEEREAQTVILVTSKQHTRRVRATWDKLVGEGEERRAIVRYAADDPYDPDDWWRNADDAQAVVHEVFALINVWLGFPLDDRRQPPS